MFAPTIALWNNDGELLWCSRYAPEVDPAEALGSTYWSFTTNKEAALKRWKAAKGGHKVQEEVDLLLDDHISTFVSTLEPIQGVATVVSVGHRKHPLTDSLTKREHEILMLLPGLDSLDIIAELEIRRSTFDTHRARMREKLECQNNAQLVAFAAIHASNLPR